MPTSMGTTLRALLLGLGLVLSLAGRAGGPFEPIGSLSVADSAEVTVENERLVGSGLALFLGPFAAHRIYLGTTPTVAIIYGLTFGGFGVLALIDLAHLLFSKDLEAYRNNDRVLMWGRPKERVTPQ
ncbi:MAG: TM2 domain-containing protein [Flavobacteriales bacterium]|nr:TM2 domain-containing protein [Flavobacteriales bacterium]